MKVKDQLTDRFKWTKGVHARNSQCEPCDIFDKDAYARCLLGWIYYCYSSTSDICKKVNSEIEEPGISIWNDKPERTFEDVKNLVVKLNI